MLKIKLTILLFTIGLFLPLFFAIAGTVLDSYKYAWSNNVGYINFGNITINDSSLEGYAWSANKGFIKFNPEQGGVLNDGAGNLSGYAWGEQLGWIDFNNVSINPTTGEFSGTATGTLVGIITFDCPNYCDVQTDWRQTSHALPDSGSKIPTPVSTSDLKFLDIEKDGIINILDFNTMMINWDATTNLATAGNIFNSADMNKDGVVDIFDFNMLMVHWGDTYQL